MGFNAFPKTWDELRAAGKKLKPKNQPIGQTLGHTFGDAPTFTYPYMWSWGGKELQEDGKTVAINSKETIESVKFMAAMWKEGCDEGALAWDDTNNNRAFLSGTISATLNGASIYITSKNKPDTYQTEKGTPLFKDILHSPLPAGPAGQFGMHLMQSDMLMKYSKNQDAGKEFLKWIHDEKNYGEWFNSQKGYSTPCTAMWGEEPVVGRRSRDGAVQGGGASRPGAGLRRPAEPEGGRGTRQIHHHRHVRQGGPGHSARRGREVGRGAS